jgi:hypothetical protein
VKSVAAGANREAKASNSQFGLTLLPDSYIRQPEALDVTIHREQYDSK